MRCDGTDQSRVRRYGESRAGLWGVLVLVTGLTGSPASGQVFDSGSDGSDGALDFSCPSPPCEVIFDPVALGLDLDSDNVFHFTTVTIAAGLTLRLLADELNWAPVYWLASGAVQIDGTIDLSGEAGHGLVLRRRSMPGPGGFHGGTAFRDSVIPATSGFGPGAGRAPFEEGAGYGTTGLNSGGALANNTYGNVFVLPLIGGSGGSGGNRINSRGGGAGGGALLIASSESITVDGGISADGGEAKSLVSCSQGGGGSGGAIRLLAPIIDGSGSLSTAGGIAQVPGCNRAGNGGAGRIRLEAFAHNFTGTTTPLFRVMTLSPNAVFLPDNPPSVRVVTVDGIAAPDRPSGNFSNPDIIINQSSTVILTIEARNVPLGTAEDPTVVTLLVFPEALGDLAVETTPLSGTFELSTASASIAFPHGFSRFTVRALWTP